MAIEESLNLDLGPALAAIRGELRNEIESIPSTLRDSFGDALTGIASDVGAMAELAKEELDRVLGAEIDVPVEVDTSQLDEATAAIDAAGQPIDAPVEVDLAGLEEAETAIDDLSGTPIEVPVDVATADIEAATDELGQLEQAAAGAADSVAAIGSAAAGTGGADGGGFAGASAGAAGLRGSIEGLTGAQIAAVGAGAGLFATIGAFAREAAQADSQTRSFELRVGDLADTLNQVNVAGLNTSLSDLALQLGADDDLLRQSIARLVQMSDGSSKTRAQVGQLGQEFVALSAYLSSVNPALGTVDDVLNSLPQALARGGRALFPFGITLSTLEIQTRAFAQTGKTAAEDLTIFDKAAAGLAITMERLGPQIADGIGAASGTAEVRMRSLKQAVLETIEEVGGPLVENVVGTLEAITPALTESAGAIARIGESALSVLQPALGAVAVAAKGAATAIQAIPTPVLAVGSAMVLGAKAAEGLISVVGTAATKLGELGRAARAIDFGGVFASGVKTAQTGVAALAAAQDAAALATARQTVAKQAATAANLELVAAQAAGVGVETAQTAATAANTAAREANAVATEAQAAVAKQAAVAQSASLGPYVLVAAAVVAGTAALIASTQHHVDHQKASDELAAALIAEAQGFTDVEVAALAAGEAVGGAALKKQLSEAFGNETLANLNAATISLDEVNAKINDLALAGEIDIGRLRRQWVSLGREVPQSAEEFERAVDSAVRSGKGNREDIEAQIRALQDLGPQLDSTRGKFFDQAEARRRLINDSVEFKKGLQSEVEQTRINAAEILKQTGAYEKLDEATQLAVDAILQKATVEEGAAKVAEANATAIQKTADAANDAASAYTAATSALGAFLGKGFDAATQELEFSIILDKTKAKQDELVKTKGKNAAAINLETVAGRENLLALGQQVKAQADLVVKNLEAGESAEKATSRYRGQVDALGKLAGEVGLTKKQYEDYLRTLGLTPAQIETQLKVAGIPEAAAELNTFKTEAEKLPINVQVNLTANERAFFEAIDRVKAKLAEIPNVDAGFAAEFAASQIPVIGKAYGGIVYGAASGGSSAGIFSQSAGVQFNEPEAGGEAYIPFALDRRARATQVLDETAREFGFALVPQARTPIALPSGSPAAGGGGGTAVLDRIASLLETLPARIPAGVNANVNLTTQEADALSQLADRLRRGH